MNRLSVTPTRRQVLFGMTGAALAYSQPRNRIYSPLLAAHTNLWVMEAALRNVRLASVLDEAFNSIQRAGYGRVELVSDFLAPDLRNRTIESLRTHKLQPAIVSAGGPLYERTAAEDSREQVLEIAQVMNGWDTRWIDYHPAAKPGPKTTAELETQAYQLNRMGQELTKTGVGLVVGHNLPEMETDAREWRYTVAHTETGLVGFCLDVECAVRGGAHPLALMDTAGSRLRSLQLRNPKNGFNQELLRDGDIDMVPIARFLRQSSYDGYLVVDLLRDPYTKREYPISEALSLSRWYMQEIFGSRPGSPPVDMGPHVRERRHG
ncbi:MAG TPA: TIM barrel protein [Bryobacteraceae bacterium]|jgi:sugar phosphate isomerase/epimerase